MEIDPAHLDVRQRYKLLIGAIVPRPIGFVSTVSPDGRANLAPFSFFSGVGSDPMTVLFCPANRPDGGDKDTLRNALPVDEGGTGEFVVNLAVEAYAREVAAAAEGLPYGDSEFDLTGLTPAPSRRVRPPRVVESPVALECRTTQVIRTNPGRPGGGNVVLGEVLLVHAADGVVNARFHVAPDAIAAVGRMGGTAFCRTRDRFSLPTGRAALAPGPEE